MASIDYGDSLLTYVHKGGITHADSSGSEQYSGLVK